MTDIPPVLGAPAPVVPQGRAAPAGDGFKWVGEGWSIYMASPLMWIIFIIIFVIANIAIAMVPFVGQLLLSLASPMVMAGVMVACRTAQNGEAIDLEQFTAGFSGKKTNPLLMLGAFYLGMTILLVIVAVILGIALVGTTVLMNPDAAAENITTSMILSISLLVLVMTALSIPLMMAYWFAVPLIQFHDVTATDALKISFKACMKNIVPFLAYGIAMLAVYVAAMVPLILSIFTLGPLIILGSLASFGILFLVAMPITFATIYTSYQGVFEDPVA